MKMPILSVRDKLIGFGTPFTAVNEAVAVRGFRHSIFANLDGATYDSTNPEDLSLYVVGEFDSVDGTISACEPHAVVYGHAIVTEYYDNCCHSFNCSGGEVDVSNEV